VTIPEGTLNSNTNYRIEIFNLTDGANPLPYVNMNSTIFLTKKLAPTLATLAMDYNPGTTNLVVTGIDYADRDVSVTSLSYNL